MDFTDEEGFFDLVRRTNEEYLKPADANIKFLEEYRGKNGINCLRLLKDAYGHLLKAIQPVDIVSNKETIDVYLKKYTNDLQNILFKTYSALIDVRMKDLLENINKDDAAQINKKIESEIDELKRIITEKKDIIKAINRFKAIYDLVETWCEKYHLA